MHDTKIIKENRIKWFVLIERVKLYGLKVFNANCYNSKINLTLKMFEIINFKDLVKNE